MNIGDRYIALIYETTNKLEEIESFNNTIIAWIGANSVAAGACKIL